MQGLLIWDTPCVSPYKFLYGMRFPHFAGACCLLLREVMVSCSKKVAIDYGQTWHNILEEYLQMRGGFVCPKTITTTTTTITALLHLPFI